ncbi:IF44L-like protein [Mya arenaria]|uniref:IF44L-like protein n=1 Tax=Mya arenaria TaxID=6604 RepID=A0ABY7FUX1_MYAAR|nr:IF44L-like protein [Mya arenaria]
MGNKNSSQRHPPSAPPPQVLKKLEAWRLTVKPTFEELISVKCGPEDIFGNIRILDTMGFTGAFGKDETGITEDDIKAVCEGRVKSGHTFNKGEAATAECNKNKPHCIAFVVSAEAVQDLTDNPDSMTRDKFLKLRDLVPDDIALIAIITKCDRICDDTNTDIENIYKSKTIENLVKRTEATFGMPQNKIFPIVNYVTESFPNEKKSLPILWAVYSAIDFAHDRKSMGVVNE